MQTFVLRRRQYGSRPGQMLLGLLALVGILCFATSCSRKDPAATRVTVTGEANLKAQPDAAVIILSVVTQNPRALNAQQENARKSDSVIHTVQSSAADAEIKTSDYSLQPQYDYRYNKLPKIIGYDARNAVSVTMSDLNGVGKVIDAASRAGANSVESVSFILRENSPARGQTLATATQQAMGKAQYIAQAMKGHVVRIVDEQESGVANAPSNFAANEDFSAPRAARVALKPTPIEAGPLSVTSRVQLVVEIEAQP